MAGRKRPSPRTTSLRPAKDEIEVSVFGPGFGECVLIHPGAGEWVVVDSCLVGPPRKRVPVALSYLRSIEVDPRDVKLVVATHWHADHMRGIARVLKACKHAKFALSQALNSDEFLEYLGALTPRLQMGSARHIAELARALATIEDRSRSEHVLARSGMRLRLKERPDYEVWALSPSQASIDRATDEFGDLIPAAGTPVRGVPAFEINDASVALLIRVGSTFILLGSDVEDVSDAKRGWKAIIADDVREPGRSELYKVAHHGGASGDSDAIWEQLLVDTPIAVLTPWMLAGRQLPTNIDRDRIVDRTEQAYITRTRGQASDPTRIEPAIAGFLSEATISVREVDQDPGHVRLRKRHAGEWRVELIDGAGYLADYDEAA